MRLRARRPGDLAGFLAVALGWCLSLASGCSRKAEAPADGRGTETRKTVHLSVLAGQSTSDAGIEEMIDVQLERTNPGTELDWERVDWGDKFQSQMQAKFAAGEVPDIMIGKAQDVATYLPSGNLAPIPPTALRFVRDDALGSVSSGGAAYGIPYNAFYQGVLYDKGIFERLGLTPPRTLEELAAAVRKLRSAGITPFASHFEESWYAGNIVMQFALGEVFERLPEWGDLFRSGKRSFSGSTAFRRCFREARAVAGESWPDAFAIGQAECDERFAKGRAAMYVSGTWSLQTIAAVNPGMKVGIFPYPNSTGDAKLVFEPNMTFMKSSKTSHAAEVDAVLEAILGSNELATEILDFTKTSSLLKAAHPDADLPIQADIDRYGAESRIVDATIGNTQLIWSFQDEVANRLRDWLQGKASLESVLEFADSHRALSGPR
jgi:ABC-type glycerol-3-phosphate transport system substrate-binding protein